MIKTVYRALSLAERAANLTAPKTMDDTEYRTANQLADAIFPIVGELREQLRLLCSLTIDIENMDNVTETIKEDWSKV